MEEDLRSLSGGPADPLPQRDAPKRTLSEHPGPRPGDTDFEAEFGLVTGRNACTTFTVLGPVEIVRQVVDLMATLPLSAVLLLEISYFNEEEGSQGGDDEAPPARQRSRSPVPVHLARAFGA